MPKTWFQVFSILQSTVKRELAPRSHPWTGSVFPECRRSMRQPSAGTEVGSWNFPGLPATCTDRTVDFWSLGLFMTFPGNSYGIQVYIIYK